MIRLLTRIADWRGRYCRIKGNRCNWRLSVSFMHCSEGGRAQVVDLKEGNWMEKSAPEGVLFSAEVLLLKQRPSLLRLRVRLA